MSTLDILYSGISSHRQVHRHDTSPTTTYYAPWRVQISHYSAPRRRSNDLRYNESQGRARAFPDTQNLHQIRPSHSPRATVLDPYIGLIPFLRTKTPLFMPIHVQKAAYFLFKRLGLISYRRTIHATHGELVRCGYACTKEPTFGRGPIRYFPGSYPHHLVWRRQHPSRNGKQWRIPSGWAPCSVEVSTEPDADNIKLDSLT